MYKILLVFISLSESLHLKPSGLRQTEMWIFALSLFSFLTLDPVPMLPEMSFALSAKMGIVVHRVAVCCKGKCKTHRRR